MLLLMESEFARRCSGCVAVSIAVISRFEAEQESNSFLESVSVLTFVLKLASFHSCFLQGQMKLLHRRYSPRA